MMTGGATIAPYRWRSEEPVHLLTLELSARPRKPISRQLANPRTKPARGAMEQVTPMRKPSYGTVLSYEGKAIASSTTKASMQTGSTSRIGMVSPRAVSGKGRVRRQLKAVFSTDSWNCMRLSSTSSMCA